MIRKLDPERREKFLSAALRLFVANGVQQTSTAEIAKEAGAAAGTLFLYFPTKQDLIHELVLIIGKQQSDNMRSLLAPSLSVQETFSTIWQGSVHWFLEHFEAYQYILQVRDSGMIADEVVQESNQFFGYYYEAIQKGLDAGCIKPYPVEMIGSILYHDIVAVVNLALGQPDPQVREIIIQQGFAIFWDGIRLWKGVEAGGQHGDL